MDIIKDIAAQIDLWNAIGVMAYIQAFIAILLVYQDRKHDTYFQISEIATSEFSMTMSQLNQRDTNRYLVVILQVIENKAKKEEDVETVKLIERMKSEIILDMNEDRRNIDEIKQKEIAFKKMVDKAHRRKIRLVLSLFVISWIMLILIPLVTYLLA